MKILNNSTHSSNKDYGNHDQIRLLLPIWLIIWLY